MQETIPAPNANRPIPWTGAEILFVYLVGLFCQVTIYMLLDRGGFYRAFYGGDGLKSILEEGGEAGKIAEYRLALWVQSFGTVLQIVAALAILRGSGATLPQMGVTKRNLGRNLVGGVVFAFIFVPGAYAIHALLLYLTKALGTPMQHHPFTILGQQSLFPIEWFFLFTSAIVLAPLWEELFYRGIIQPWAVADQPRSGPTVLGATLLWTVATRRIEFAQAYEVGGVELLRESMPIVVLLAMVPVYYALNRKSGEWSALFATAVLFGWIHVKVWPSPVPLLWLALGLGWLRWKGQSLAGCVMLHAVFNAISCVALLWR